MELKRMDYVLLKGLFLLVAGIVITQTTGLESMTSMLFMLTFPLTVLLWMRTVRQTVTAMDLLVVGTIVLAGLCVLLDLTMHNGSITFSYLKKYIMFAMTLLFFQAAYRIRLDDSMVWFIHRTASFMAWFLVYMYLTERTMMYVIEGRLTRFLTFYMGNPNKAGLFLGCLFILELCCLFSSGKWRGKIFHGVTAGILVAFILLTQSRNSILAVVIVLAFCVWLVFQKKTEMRVRRGIAVVVAVLPALFLFAYMTLLNTPWMEEHFSFLVSEGKALDSRVAIWRPALEALRGSPLIGAYWEISGGTGGSQMHNTHLDIAVSYGIPVLILVCILLYRYVYQNGRTYSDKQTFVYVLGFMGALMLGIGEAALFSGGTGLYILVGGFLLLANRKLETEGGGDG